MSKVIREFNAKLVGACLELMVDGEGASGRTAKLKVNRLEVSVEEETDSTYELH